MLTYLRIRLNAHLARMDQRGATAVEYGLIIAGVALVCIPVTIALLKTVSVIFNDSQSDIVGTP